MESYARGECSKVLDGLGEEFALESVETLEEICRDDLWPYGEDPQLLASEIYFWGHRKAQP